MYLLERCFNKFIQNILPYIDTFMNVYYIKVVFTILTITELLHNLKYLFDVHIKYNCKTYSALVSTYVVESKPLLLQMTKTNVLTVGSCQLNCL